MWVSHIVVEIDALSISETSATFSELCHQVVVIPLSLPGKLWAQNLTLNPTVLMGVTWFSPVSPNKYRDFTVDLGCCQFQIISYLYSYSWPLYDLCITCRQRH